MFSSQLHREVFPFFNNPDIRVSILGNLGIVKK